MPSGNVDEHLPVVRHTLQLLRLGSFTREMPDVEPPLTHSHLFVQPGSLGDIFVGTPPISCAVPNDETELDMFASMEHPKRTRSRLSLPVRKTRSIKYQPLVTPEDVHKTKSAKCVLLLNTCK